MARRKQRFGRQPTGGCRIYTCCCGGGGGGAGPRSRTPVRSSNLLVEVFDTAGDPSLPVRSKPCVNGRTVAVGAYFGVDGEGIATRLFGEQLTDGGWNCEAEDGSVRLSLDTAICVLEGLLQDEQATRASLNRRCARPRRGVPPATLPVSVDHFDPHDPKFGAVARAGDLAELAVQRDDLHPSHG